MEELGRRLDAINDLSSKGVHADVTIEEADQCVLQTYLLVGGLARATDGQEPAADRPGKAGRC